MGVSTANKGYPQWAVVAASPGRHVLPMDLQSNVLFAPPMHKVIEEPLQVFTVESNGVHWSLGPTHRATPLATLQVRPTAWQSNSVWPMVDPVQNRTDVPVQSSAGFSPHGAAGWPGMTQSGTGAAVPEHVRPERPQVYETYVPRAKSHARR